MESINTKRTRLIELILVICFAYLLHIVTSAFKLARGTDSPPLSQDEIDLSLLSGIIRKALDISVVIYILFRQGRRLKDIGFTISFTDVWHAIALFVLVYILAMGIRKTEFYLFPDIKYYWAPKNLSFMNGRLTLIYIISQIANPVHEELIVRGYVMTEVKFLSNNIFLAILLSVGIQFSYHLYQGLVPAILLLPIFILFAVYFARFKRIFPVIIAHMIFDLLAMVHHAR